MAHDCVTEFNATCQRCADHDATCGRRCDTCDERLCAWFGPEPALTCDGHTLCTDCDQTNHCMWCKDARTAA